MEIIVETTSTIPKIGLSEYMQVSNITDYQALIQLSETVFILKGINL